MKIPKNSPIDAKHPLIKKQFNEWWYFLNSVGIFSFLLFVGCLGAGENKYFCSLLSAFLVAWIIWIGKNNFPEFIVKIRASKYRGAKQLEKKIMKEQMPIFLVPITYFGYWLGMFSLLLLLVYPIFIVNNIKLYIPSL